MVHVFIINPEFNESEFPVKLRETLSRIPDLNYYVFTTGAAGDETQLASTIEDIFEGEQVRIYSCGGITTARNVLEGITDLSKIEFAIIPSENVKYLSAFGSQESFKDVQKLISGKTVRVDYIKTNHGVALNSVSFGLDTYSHRCYENLKSMLIFGNRVSWFMANIYSAMMTPNYSYNLKFDDTEASLKLTQIHISNVPIWGKNVVDPENRNVAEGIASCVTVYRFGFFSRIKYVIDSYRHSVKYSKDDSRQSIRGISSAKVRHATGVPIWCSLDGKQILATDWNINVIKQGLKMVIPSEAEYEGK